MWAGTKDGLSDPSVPGPALDGVIWGDGFQYLSFFKTKSVCCSSKTVAFKKISGNSDCVSISQFVEFSHQ